MIVIGLDVDKQSVTAVAVDPVGRMLDEKTVAVGGGELLGWAAALDAERLWTGQRTASCTSRLDATFWDILRPWRTLHKPRATTPGYLNW